MHKCKGLRKLEKTSGGWHVNGNQHKPGLGSWIFEPILLCIWRTRNDYSYSYMKYHSDAVKICTRDTTRKIENIFRMSSWEGVNWQHRRTCSWENYCLLLLSPLILCSEIAISYIHSGFVLCVALSCKDLS